MSRYPGSALIGHNQVAFDEQRFFTGPVTVNEDRDRIPPKMITVSGKTTRLFYWSPVGRSGLEVFENYKQAMAKAGITPMWSCSGDEACGPVFENYAVEKMRLEFSNMLEARQGTADASEVRYVLGKLARPEGDVYVAVFVCDLDRSERRAATYVAIAETKPMDEGMVTVNASALEKALASTGKVLIYGLSFDVDKTAIKPESKAQLDEIAGYLQQHPDVKLAIVGHTDSQGTAAHNQKLSQGRADAVVAALVRDYTIAAVRLTAQGVGSSSPVASNDTEEGRAKNRRVELVKR